MKQTHSVQLLEYPGSQKSALWGMKDLLDHASVQADRDLNLQFDARISRTPDHTSDIVVLPPALSLQPPAIPQGWAETLASMHRSGTILASVCSGAFLLAATGRLDQRRITTHWKHIPLFRERYPDIILDEQKLVVDLGDIVTAGGVMAWTDLTLHLIERLTSRRIMLDAAKMFVLDPPRREQSFYATFTPNRSHPDQKIAEVQDLLQHDPSANHTIASLAQTTSLSERSLLRRFKQATGKTPLAYLQLLRVEGARSRLELTKDNFEQISWDMGYRDVAAFRHIFKRALGLTPSQYRRRFGAERHASRVEDREM